jgi:small subunit ribosomal protein S1
MIGSTGNEDVGVDLERDTEDMEDIRPRKRTVTRRLFADDPSQDEAGELEGATPEGRMAQDELLGMYEESMKDLEEGEIVRGTVLRVDDKEVLVDVGFKSEGVIQRQEFADPESIKPGDQIEVFLEKMENQDGLVVLSKQRADFVKVWDRVKEAADQGQVVEGRLVRKIKGGVVVDLFGVEAFLPGSQIALRQVQNVDQFLNQTLKFKIIKLNKRRRNIVVSRRAVLEEERANQKTTLLKDLAKDQVREGVVKNITDFGAFVDLGGIDGLLHITDMSWGRVGHPSEIVSIGERVRVKVLNFDPDRERISLGLKQLQPYPWEHVEQKYPVGSRVSGKVVSITDYGAFVELEKGVEGLIHISEMSWTRHVRHPSKILNVGDPVEAMVLRVDKANEKISLGLKQVEPDPWQTMDQKYPQGMRLSGKVRNLTNFGAFVELEEGIDGLVHISDMSWTKRVNHPSEVVKKGDRVDVVVLAVDKDNRRISLGLKQTRPDPWYDLADHYPEGRFVTAKVSKVLDRGLIMDLGEDIEGFVPISQLGLDNIKKATEMFEAGEELRLKVSKVDTMNHRITLSLKASLSEMDKQALEEFKAAHSTRKTVVGDEEKPAGEAKPEGKKKGKKARAESHDEAPAEAAPSETPAADEASTDGPVAEAAPSPEPTGESDSPS